MSKKKSLFAEVLNLKEFEEYLDDFPDEAFKDAKEAFQKAVLDAQSQVSGNFGPKLHVRSGTLRRSIQTSVEGDDLASLDARIFGEEYAGGSQLAYTLTQQFGATIRAADKYKNVPGGPYLNVPLPANRTAAGVTRMGAREVFNAGGYIKGRAVFSQDGQAMFALVREVKVPAALGLIEAAEDQVPTLLSTLQKYMGEH